MGFRVAEGSVTGIVGWLDADGRHYPAGFNWVNDGEGWIVKIFHHRVKFCTTLRLVLCGTGSSPFRKWWDNGQWYA